MAGYIGKSQGVTQVDGYNRSEADAEFLDQTEGDARYVEVAGDTMTGSLVVPYGLIDNNTEYSGMSIRNTRTSFSTSYIDSQNRINAADSHIFFTHGTDGSSTIRFGTQPPGDFTDRRVDGHMVIDQLGRVTMPSQARCVVTQDGGWRTLTAGTSYGVSSGGFPVNNGGFFNGGQINGFNVVHMPVSGWYRFDMYTYSGNGCPAGARFILMKNNSEEMTFVQTPSTADCTTLMSKMFYMTANDYVNYKVAPPGFPNFTAYFANNHTMLAISLEG